MDTIQSESVCVVNGRDGVNLSHLPDEVIPGRGGTKQMPKWLEAVMCRFWQHQTIEREPVGVHERQ